MRTVARHLAGSGHLTPTTSLPSQVTDVPARVRKPSGVTTALKPAVL